MSFQEFFQVQFILLWLISFALIMIVSKIAILRLGKESINVIRSIKSVSLIIITIPAAILAFLLFSGKLELLIDLGLANFIMLPFFISVTYFMTVVFREWKRKRMIEKCKK